MAVVAHHADLRTSAFVGASPLGATWMRHGALGVDFFFVLSGFIILHAHGDDSPTGRSALRFATRRLARIFPGYWPISIALLLAYGALPSLSAAGGREYSLLSSLLLIPSNGPPALSVAWTLIHEMIFYTVFLTFFVSRRLFVAGMAVWSVCNLASLTREVHGWHAYVLSPLNLEFVLGMLAAAAVRRGIAKGVSPGLLVSAGLVLAGLALLLTDDGSQGAVRVMFAFGVAVMVWGAAIMDQQNDIRYPRLLLYLGGASYAIYLVHNPLMSLSQRGLARLSLGWWPSYFVGVGLSILAGVVYYRFVENPLRLRIRDALGPRNPRA